MAGTLFQKDVRIKRVTTLGHIAAQALNDPVRIKILEILSHKQMSAEEITKALGSSGYKKATTTIRHHLDTLKVAGLIEATRMVEVRGAVMKYYAPTLRAFSYDAPDLEKHTKIVDDTGTKMLKVLKGVLEDKKFVTSFAGKDSCNQCKVDHYREYAALEILNAAIAKAMDRKEYAEIVAGKE
ncbi:MAG TPA: winged helix-turn-helix domain-containing protein [Nitrososphaera sp.]|nr:winged helix-turn-helix domain-containing protein [Nitrososphaera sp.]